MSYKTFLSCLYHFSASASASATTSTPSAPALASSTAQQGTEGASTMDLVKRLSLATQQTDRAARGEPVSASVLEERERYIRNLE